MTYLKYLSVKLLYSMGKVPFLPHIAWLRLKLFVAKHLGIGNAFSVGIEFLAKGNGKYLRQQILWSVQNQLLLTLLASTTADTDIDLREWVNDVEEEITEAAIASYYGYKQLSKMMGSTDPQLMLDYLMQYAALAHYVVNVTATDLRSLEVTYKGVLPKEGFTNLDNFRKPEVKYNG